MDEVYKKHRKEIDGRVEVVKKNRKNSLKNYEGMVAAGRHGVTEGTVNSTLNLAVLDYEEVWSRPKRRQQPLS
ncbi:hypothetical protein MRB53_003008 [Persea americana]|uniref:Uncharacterized protein n=1 Tax=Persea americana TaxID=3435 RepID=A0ACC2MX12_PERAE|nr:hypothetical protein MRB53_003008 [Persea americana]